MDEAADAVVIGAGQNGLVAANILADAGWEVLVLEEQPAPGGSVRSADGPAPGFVTDLCAAFYPLAAASRAYAALALEDDGLRWVHAPTVLAHPLPDGRAAVLSRDLDTTVAGLERLGRGDGAAWERLYGNWRRVSPMLLDSLFVPFPPVRAGVRLAVELGPAGLLKFARFGLLPARRLAEEEFSGPGGSLLLAGCALHADLMPESAGSGMFGWLLSMLGQQYGFPVPQGGAGQLTAAMVRRLRRKGGQLRCGAPVREVVVRGGRAVGVRTAGGGSVSARRAVLADVPATQLYGGLVDWAHLPPRLRDDLRRFQWDYATFKLDWALRGPVPWASDLGGAGTVHVSAGMDEMTEYTAQIAMGRIPARPFVLMGQMTTADPSRSPAGTESLWAYTHVPREVRGDAGDDGISGKWDDRDEELFAARVEAQIERFAPGFRDLISARTVTAPPKMAAHNANLVGGAINGGTTAPHQQLVFRPTPGLGRPETPVAALYLASSSAHPGGAVHGACGANAARTALRGHLTRSQRMAAAATRIAIGR